MSIELALVPIAIALTQTIGSQIEKKRKTRHTYAIKTIMKDAHILQTTLNNYGCAPTIIGDGEMKSEIGNVQILFQQTEQNIFEAVFANEIDVEQAAQFLTNIQEEYGHLVQQETYKKLLERAKQQGLLLETEEVSDTNSIVLTFKVN
ncbi:hypothetical protein ABEP42_13835 [Priestia megaterium]|uniref:hypothetical protein n=1 Tax=Priestia megaterium TaxID=1404 RepID=UPI00317EC100